MLDHVSSLFDLKKCMFMTIIELLIYIEFFKILIYNVWYNNIMFSFHNLFSSMTLTNSL